MIQITLTQFFFSFALSQMAYLEVIFQAIKRHIVKTGFYPCRKETLIPF